MTRKWSWLSGAVGAITVATTMLLAGWPGLASSRVTITRPTPVKTGVAEPAANSGRTTLP